MMTVNKIRKKDGWFDLSVNDQFIKRNGYSMNVMRQTACYVVSPATVNTFIALFNCTPARRATDFQSSWCGLDALSLIGSTGVQLLNFYCSSVGLAVE